MTDLTSNMCADRPPFEIFIEGCGVMQRLYDKNFASFIFEIYVRHSIHRNSQYHGKRIILYKDGAMICEHVPPLVQELANYFAILSKTQLNEAIV
jgi:hypothetical protein